MEEIKMITESMLKQINDLKLKQRSIGEKRVSLSESSKVGEIKCKLCGGSGFIREIENGYEVYEKCACYIEEMNKRKLRFANLPESLKSATLKDVSYDMWKTAESKSILAIAFKQIKTYLENFEEMQKEGMGLYITSKTKGSGKTHMIACICNELLNKGHQVKFATSADILQEIRNTYTDTSEYTESKLLDALFTTEILVIDDFGQERVKDWSNDKFYQIINTRYLNRKVTLYTSNESIHTLRYDERITSRVKERVFEIHYAEESIRDNKAITNIDRLTALMNA